MCVCLPVGALCHGTGRWHCWMRPGRWGWPGGDPLYGTGAFCPNHFPGMSRTAHCGATMDPEFENTEVRSHIFPDFKQRLTFLCFPKKPGNKITKPISLAVILLPVHKVKNAWLTCFSVNDVLFLCPSK